MKHFLKSKTIWASLVLILLPIIMNYFTPETLKALGIGNPLLVSLIGGIFAWLRSQTNQPVTISLSKAKDSEIAQATK